MKARSARGGYKGERLRSWSYYERGQGLAAREVLRTLWAAYTEDTGIGED